MDEITKNYLDKNRIKLHDYVSSLIFFSWCDIALEQGMDADQVFFQVMTFNLKGEVAV